jgi:ABC-type cobalt transport system substrate-binding protein
MAKKKIQMAGGVKQGEANPTWLKQSGDVQVLAFGGALVGFGLIQLVMGIYKLAYNKGRKE